MPSGYHCQDCGGEFSPPRIQPGVVASQAVLRFVYAEAAIKTSHEATYLLQVRASHGQARQ